MLHVFVIWYASPPQCPLYATKLTLPLPTREDMNSSIALCSAPHLPHAPCCAMIRIPLLYPHMPKPEFLPNDPLHSTFTSLTRLARLILHPATIQDVENLSSQLLCLNDATNPYLASAPSSHYTFSPADLARRAEERARIDRNLQSMPPLSSIPPERRTLADYTHEAARLGCRIYTHTVLSRNLPLPLSLLLDLTNSAIELLTTAQDLHILDLKRQCPPQPFFWLLFLGGVLPLGQEQEVWFAARIVECLGHCEVFRTFAESPPAGRGMCWGSQLGTSPVRGLWRRVEGLWERERMGRAREEGFCDEV